MPPHILSEANLNVGRPTPGLVWHHIFEDKHPNPLGFGYSSSRFSDPRRSPKARFGVFYMGSSFETAFLETIVRDTKVGKPGPLKLSKQLLIDYVHVAVTFDPISLVDLTGANPVKYGLATNIIRAKSHRRGQSAALAIYNRTGYFDGILYPSRLTTEQNIAIFDRSISKLRASGRRRLIDCPEITDILDSYTVSLV